jgi:hypothetical protein
MAALKRVEAELPVPDISRELGIVNAARNFRTLAGRIFLHP